MLARSFLWSTVIVFGLTLSSVARAANFTADGNITVSSVEGTGVTASMLIISGSAAASWQYNSGVFSVTNPDSSAGFQVGSSDSSVLCLIVRDNVNSPVVQASNTTPGTSYVTLPTTAGTYKVIPSVSACATSAATGSSGPGNDGGSSGGGSGPSNDSPVAPTTPVVSAAPVGPVVLAPLNLFKTVLGLGAKGNDVKALQQFLNKNDFLVAASGAGSPGQETLTFGPATRAALLRFQLRNGLIKSSGEAGAGSLGLATMAKINSLLTITPNLTPTAMVMAPATRQALIQSLTAQLATLMVKLQQLRASQVGR